MPRPFIYEEPCDICGSTACERETDGTLLGCPDCGYDAMEHPDPEEDDSDA